MYLGEYRIDDYVLLAVQLHRFSSGAEYAATGTPTYTIYENNSVNGPDGNAAAAVNLANLATETGLWTARVQLTAAAGYEAGKDYLARIEATVDGVTAAEVQTFRVIGNPKVDVDTIKAQGVTCGAAVTIRADVGHAGVPGAENGAPYVAAGGAKIAQTVDLTAGQSIACSDKTGFSLSATGADLILKSSTFVQAIVAAVNELATYGLTALNTLLVTTGIKTATTAAPTDMALNSTVAKDATVSKPGTAQTIIPPADMALNSTVAKEATLGTVAGYIDTEITAIINAIAALNNLSAAQVTAAVPTTAQIKTAIEAVGSHLTLIKAKTDNLPTDPADQSAVEAAITAATAPLATAANLATVDSNIDAVKAQTDKLTFTSGNDLDANVQKINDVALTGDGSATPWGPA